MRRAVVNVATGAYVKGSDRLESALAGQQCDYVVFRDCLPAGSPFHKDVPYAFKAHAIEWCRTQGYDTVLWADSCIVPQGSLEPLWQRIERDGYWVSRNGWQNGEWCSDAALPLLGITREEAMEQPHVVATAFGLSLRHPLGSVCAQEYLAFAKNGAFCGPWNNEGGVASKDRRVLGHRHDQTALSVLAARLGFSLTEPPDVFAYKGAETAETLLIADGAY